MLSGTRNLYLTRSSMLLLLLLLLKATLKDVFESKSINETQFKLTIKSYVERISLIRHFTNLFQVLLSSYVLSFALNTVRFYFDIARVLLGTSAIFAQ